MQTKLQSASVILCCTRQRADTCRADRLAACLQESEGLQHGPIPVCDLLVHDLVQNGDAHAQQHQRLLGCMAVCVEVLIQRQPIAALHTQRDPGTSEKFLL